MSPSFIAHRRHGHGFTAMGLRVEQGQPLGQAQGLVDQSGDDLAPVILHHAHPLRHRPGPLEQGLWPSAQPSAFANPARSSAIAR